MNMRSQVILLEEGDWMIYDRETQRLWFENRNDERIPFNGNKGSIVYPTTNRDMTEEMLAKSRVTKNILDFGQVEFREGLAETLPVEDGWADVVISNGVINLCVDKQATFAEIFRVLRPGGRLQFADIANGLPVPEEAMRQIDLWTG